MSGKRTAPLGLLPRQGEGPRWPGRVILWTGGKVGEAGMCFWSERPGCVTEEQIGQERSGRSPGQAGIVLFREIREARTTVGDVIKSAAWQ